MDIHRHRYFIRCAAALFVVAAVLPRGTPAMAQNAQALNAPAFSVARGFFDAPFEVSLSANDGASIRYTLDGATPSVVSGTLYSGPILIETTAIVRAVAYSGPNAVSAVATHTYLFPADVRKQSATQPGWPDQFARPTPDGAYPADYEMDPEVLDHPNYAGDVFVRAMKAVPSVSVVTDFTNLWDRKAGIYFNPYSKEPYQKDPLGLEWERLISIEWIDPSGAPGFAENAGMRIHGNASRLPSRTPKKSFRIAFRRQYGVGKLAFDLFEQEDAAVRFDKLVLRNGGNRSFPYHDGAQRAAADYVNDEWARRAWENMGHVAPHGTYVHLYLNGLYWGLYNVTERLDADFYSEYFGGETSDYEVIAANEQTSENEIQAASGTMDAYLKALVTVEGNEPLTDAEYASLSAQVDMTQLADYFLHVHYIGKRDFSDHNFNVFRRTRGPDTRFKFTPWDNDSGLLNRFENVTKAVDDVGPDDAPTRIFARAATHPLFRRLLSDRLYLHVISPTGALTPESCARLYSDLAEKVYPLIVPESARWGDYARDTMPLTNTVPRRGVMYLHSRDLPADYTDKDGVVTDTLQTNWVDIRDNKLDKYCPERAQNVIRQYVANGWHQELLQAPSFSALGGVMPENFALTLGNVVNKNIGNIYYTLDGSDPRLSDDTLSPAALNGSDVAAITGNQNTTVSARVFSGTVWSPLAQYTFYTPQPFEHLVINEIHYNPEAGKDGNSDDFEFIELFNRGNQAIQLDGVRFDRGVTYHFSAGASIGPGQYLVLASDADAFAKRYGFEPFGDYRGNLANGGETLRLSTPSGEVIDSVDFDDKAPWDTQADGAGGSLSLVDSQADNSDASRWSASGADGGTPRAINTASGAGPVQAASVSIAFPQARAVVAKDALVAIQVKTGDSDRRFAQLAVMADGAVIPGCVRTKLPFACKWTPDRLGNIKLTAILTDTMGGVVSSAAVDVSIAAASQQRTFLPLSFQ
jgi:hypothetical protein